ncbi:cyclin-Q-like [Gigantopelta aegis]|uniref:cyclin-Q-like n=1 Tax=Gigantopelta aegis TaxID=1735272 RepID=UPI001B88CA16|nr:cyclin-Q-like [Gigantopelta aegis]
MADSQTRVHFRVIKYIHESGLRLHMKSVPLATASVLYHKFFTENSLQDFDPYLIAMTCIYLAGKVEEEHLKLRDVINVCYRVLHRTKPLLEIGESFWALRETVANCELFILRMLRFKISFVHPHKYLLHYLKYLQDWFAPYKWQALPIARTAWSYLRDSYHGNLCLQYKPQHMAVAVLYFSLLSLGVDVPHHHECDTKWWKVFAEDISLSVIKDIISDIVSVYELEDIVDS